MKTEALKQKKRELEAKLMEIERAVTTFTRKIVYIREDGAQNNGIPVDVSFQPKPPKKSTNAKK